MKLLGETLLTIIMFPLIMVLVIGFCVFYEIVVLIIFAESCCLVLKNKCRKMSKRKFDKK
jgi:hypothetical protein